MAQTAPSAADEGEADEKSQEENRARNRDGNCTGLSQTFFIFLAYFNRRKNAYINTFDSEGETFLSQPYSCPMCTREDAAEECFQVLIIRIMNDQKHCMGYHQST